MKRFLKYYAAALLAFILAGAVSWLFIEGIAWAAAHLSPIGIGLILAAVFALVVAFLATIFSMEG